MINALIVQAFSAQKTCVHFLAAPMAAVCLIGGEKQSLWQRQKQRLGLWLSSNVLINWNNLKFNPVLRTVEVQMGTAEAQCCTLVCLFAPGSSGFGCRSSWYECLDFSATSESWFGVRCQKHTVILNWFPLTAFNLYFLDGNYWTLPLPKFQ